MCAKVISTSFQILLINQIKQISSGTEKQSNAAAYYLTTSFCSPSAVVPILQNLITLSLQAASEVKIVSITNMVLLYLSFIWLHMVLYAFPKQTTRPLWFAWIRNWTLMSWISARSPDWDGLSWKMGLSPQTTYTEDSQWL